MNSKFRISQLSDGPGNPSWSVAVFAYNEAGQIGAALASIVEAAAGNDVRIYVLANGCTDATIDEVRTCAANIAHLWLVEIDLGDKANAWNLYIHEVLSGEQAGDIETHFFMDADVTLEANALPLLVTALQEVPSAVAAGGMPATGRDRDAWRRRMVANGMLAGNLYALRASFVERLREHQLRMPVGLIGEDFLVSWLVATDIGRPAAMIHNVQCTFAPRAEFSFRSLSPSRLADYPTYARRKWRYTFRGLQHQMLILLLIERGVRVMPADIEELYRVGPLPSRLRWEGLVNTVLRLLAVMRIRSVRERAANRQ